MVIGSLQAMPAASTETDVERDARANDAAGSAPDQGSIPVAGALAAILVVAAALRFYGLGDDSLWDNEILSVQRAKAPLSEVPALLRAGTHPPLYSQGVLRPVFILGQNEFVQRFPSAVFGVVTVAMTYVLTRRTFGWQAGLAAAALLAVLPLHVYYSREGRMYALLALLVTLWIASLLVARRRNTRWAWAVYAVLGAGILYTHYYAGLTIAAVLGVTGATYLTTSSDTATRRRWLVSSTVIGLLFLPWLPTFLHQLRNSSSNLPGRPIGETPDLLTQFFTGFADVPAIVKTLVLVAITVLIVLLLGSVRRASRTPDSDLFPVLVMIGAVVGTILLAVAVSLFKPILYVRYFAGVLPTFCVLLAAAAVGARRRVVGWVAYGVLFLVSIAFVIPVVTESWRPDFGGVIDRIVEVEPDAAVLLVAGPNRLETALSGLDHYNGARIPVQTIDIAGVDEGVADAIADLSSDPSHVWLLQHQAIRRINAPDGFDVTFEERYDSHFFEYDFPMRLTLLESAP